LSLIVVKLHVNKGKLLLESRNISLRDIFIEGFLGHKLATEVLDLKSELSFDSCILLSHDVSPNQIKLVENLRNASLSHFSIELSLEILDFLDSQGWNPFICVDCVLIFGNISLLSCFNTESAADDSNILLGEILGLSQNLNIIKILIIAGILQ